MSALLFQLLAAEIHFLGQVVAEAFLRLREEVLFEHQEVRVLAGGDGTLGGLHAQERIPAREVVHHVVTGPGDQGAAVPDRLATEQLAGALVAQHRGEDLRISGVPPGPWPWAGSCRP